MKTIQIIIISFSTIFSLVGQHTGQEWKLIKNSDEMEIYTRLPENSKYKEVKMKIRVDAPPAEVREFISYAPRFPDWIYSCSESHRVANGDFKNAYYIRFDMKWPFSDRDLVQSSTTRIDSSTGVIDIYTNVVKGLVPELKDCVRIRENEIFWKLIPDGPGSTLIEYHVITNPGGSIPAWLMNMVATVGPRNSMKNLIEYLEKDFNDLEN